MPVKLAHVTDEYMAQNLIDLLRAEGIDSYYQPEGDGGLTQVYAGHSIFGYEIYVRESDRQRAEEVLENFDFE